MAKAENFPWLSPHFVVKDTDAAIEFFTQAFGFEKTDSMQDDNGKTVHVQMNWRDGVVMFAPEGAWESPMRTPNSTSTPSPVGFYVYCDDVDQQYDRAVTAGALSVKAPEDTFWGDRMCTVQCPDGYHWSFASTIS